MEVAVEVDLGDPIDVALPMHSGQTPSCHSPGGIVVILGEDGVPKWPSSVVWLSSRAGLSRSEGVACGAAVESDVAVEAHVVAGPR